MEYRQLRTIGGKGGGKGQFAESLRAIALSRRNGIYAAGDSSVKVFGTDGSFQSQWATALPGESIAIGEDGSVFVGESGQLEIFSTSGKLLRTWRDDALLAKVTAIGFAGDSVLVADAGDRCIRRFDRSGKFLHNIGKDNRMKGFLIPNGVLDFSVDAGGIIHASNPGKHRIETYTLEGAYLGHIGRFDGLDPAGFPGCCNPTNVTVTGRDRIYVTEKAGPRVKVYDFQGNLLSVIANSGFDAACKNMDIAVGSNGDVYVADTVRLHTVVLTPAGPSAQLERGEGRWATT